MDDSIKTPPQKQIGKGIGVIVVVVIVLIVLFYFILSQNPQNNQAVMPTTTMQNQKSNNTVVPSDNIYLIRTDRSKGKYLTDSAGMTLYIFDKDRTGVSNCNGGCDHTWKPYTSGATAQSQFPSNIAVLKRSDNSLQFSYKGFPLYYYSFDQKTGDILGDGVGGVWHVAKP